ncbi:MAG: citrate/2-methylcitrate synthase [Litorilinea sp.]
MPQQYLTAKEVTRELGISFGTLYSYVSRGLIRSEETNGQTRHKRYSAEDVAALRNRRERRRNPTTSAATALDFGDPVLESAVTLIQDGQLYYRGQLATDLARRQSAETVAGLLWNNNLTPELTPLPAHSTVMRTMLQTLLPALPATLTPVERFHVLLPVAESQDLAAHEKTPAAVCRTAGRIYALFITALTGKSPSPHHGLADHLAAWAQTSRANPAHPGARDADTAITELFNAALILCADHELNVSSFTARCVASTGATPYGAVAAALAALQGPRHGGDAARCEALLREAQVNPRQALAAWLRRGERLPGFGHRLYPDGDPRATFLLDLMRRHHAAAEDDLFQSTTPAASLMHAIDRLIDEVQATFGLHPTIDMALATLALTCQLPPGASLSIFTAGRVLGWFAHILEQYQSDVLIRPRARYAGPQSPPDRD